MKINDGNKIIWCAECGEQIKLGESYLEHDNEVFCSKFCKERW